MNHVVSKNQQSLFTKLLTHDNICLTDITWKMLNFLPFSFVVVRSLSLSLYLYSSTFQNAVVCKFLDVHILFGHRDDICNHNCSGEYHIFACLLEYPSVIYTSTNTLISQLYPTLYYICISTFSL